MKIALLSQFFPPEPCAAAIRVDALVKALRRAGHEVTVVTAFPSFPERRLARGDRFCLVRREERYGARVTRLLTMQFGRMPLARLAHWSVTALSFLCYLLATPRHFDAIVVTTPPITLALPAVAGAWRHRAKLVLDVRDVYPDVAIAMGMWQKDGPLARAVEYVSRQLYKRAALITSVTPATVAQIASRGVDTSRLMLVTNGADEASITRSNERNPRQFRAVYVGNIGLVADAGILVDAARVLASDERFAITIVGDGAQAAEIRGRIRAAGLRNISLIGSVPREEALRRLSEADVALATVRKGITDCIPAKIFDAFSVGCPVIVCADGEAAAIMEKCEGGLAVPAGDASGLAEALERFSALSEEARTACGERGRAFVRRFYSREAIMDDLSRRIAAC